MKKTAVAAPKDEIGSEKGTAKVASAPHKPATAQQKAAEISRKLDGWTSRADEKEVVRLVRELIAADKANGPALMKALGPKGYARLVDEIEHGERKELLALTLPFADIEHKSEAVKTLSSSFIWRLLEKLALIFGFADDRESIKAIASGTGAELFRHGVDFETVFDNLKPEHQKAFVAEAAKDMTLPEKAHAIALLVKGYTPAEKDAAINQFIASVEPQDRAQLRTAINGELNATGKTLMLPLEALPENPQRAKDVGQKTEALMVELATTDAVWQDPKLQGAIATLGNPDATKEERDEATKTLSTFGKTIDGVYGKSNDGVSAEKKRLDGAIAEYDGIIQKAQTLKKQHPEAAADFDKVIGWAQKQKTAVQSLETRMLAWNNAAQSENATGQQFLAKGVALTDQTQATLGEYEKLSTARDESLKNVATNPDAVIAAMDTKPYVASAKALHAREQDLLAYRKELTDAAAKDHAFASWLNKSGLLDLVDGQVASIGVQQVEIQEITKSLHRADRVQVEEKASKLIGESAELGGSVSSKLMTMTDKQLDAEVVAYGKKADELKSEIADLKKQKADAEAVLAKNKKPYTPDQLIEVNMAMDTLNGLTPVDKPQSLDARIKGLEMARDVVIAGRDDIKHRREDLKATINGGLKFGGYNAISGTDNKALIGGMRQFGTQLIGSPTFIARGDELTITLKTDKGEKTFKVGPESSFGEVMRFYNAFAMVQEQTIANVFANAAGALESEYGIQASSLPMKNGHIDMEVLPFSWSLLSKEYAKAFGVAAPQFDSVNYSESYPLGLDRQSIAYLATGQGDEINPPKVVTAVDDIFQKRAVLGSQELREFAASDAPRTAKELEAYIADTSNPVGLRETAKKILGSPELWKEMGGYDGFVGELRAGHVKFLAERVEAFEKMDPHNPQPFSMAFFGKAHWPKGYEAKVNYEKAPPIPTFWPNGRAVAADLYGALQDQDATRARGILQGLSKEQREWVLFEYEATYPQKLQEQIEKYGPQGAAMVVFFLTSASISEYEVATAQSFHESSQNGWKNGYYNFDHLNTTLRRQHNKQNDEWGIDLDDAMHRELNQALDTANAVIAEHQAALASGDTKKAEELEKKLVPLVAKANQLHDALESDYSAAIDKYNAKLDKWAKISRTVGVGMVATAATVLSGGALGPAGAGWLTASGAAVAGVLIGTTAGTAVGTLGFLVDEWQDPAPFNSKRFWGGVKESATTSFSAALGTGASMFAMARMGSEIGKLAMLARMAGVNMTTSVVGDLASAGLYHFTGDEEQARAILNGLGTNALRAGIGVFALAPFSRFSGVAGVLSDGVTGGVETVAWNKILGKPWDEGVAEGALMGVSGSFIMQAHGSKTAAKSFEGHEGKTAVRVPGERAGVEPSWTVKHVDKGLGIITVENAAGKTRKYLSTQILDKNPDFGQTVPKMKLEGPSDGNAAPKHPADDAIKSFLNNDEASGHALEKSLQIDAPGFNVQLASAKKNGDTLNLEIALRDSSGAVVGSFSRRLTVENGRMVVENDAVFIDPAHQDKGLASKVRDAEDKLYSGFTIPVEVRVIAEAPDGVAHWARRTEGYAFDNSKAPGLPETKKIAAAAVKHPEAFDHSESMRNGTTPDNWNWQRDRMAAEMLDLADKGATITLRNGSTVSLADPAVKEAFTRAVADARSPGDFHDITVTVGGKQVQVGNAMMRQFGGEQISAWTGTRTVDPKTPATSTDVILRRGRHVDEVAKDGVPFERAVLVKEYTTTRNGKQVHEAIVVIDGKRQTVEMGPGKWMPETHGRSGAGMTKGEMQVYTTKLGKLPADQQKIVTDVIGGARTPEEQAVLVREFTSGGTPEDMVALQKIIHDNNLSAAEVLKFTTVDGLYQHFGNSCAPTTEQFAAISVSPLAALTYYSELNTQRADQHASLKRAGSAVKDLDGKVVETGRSSGLDADQLAASMNRFIGPRLKIKFVGVDVHPRDRKAFAKNISAQLQAGRPEGVPIGVKVHKGGGHAMIALESVPQKRVVGGKTVVENQLTIRDPSSGETRLIWESDLASGKAGFDLVSGVMRGGIIPDRPAAKKAKLEGNLTHYTDAQLDAVDPGLKEFRDEIAISKADPDSADRTLHLESVYEARVAEAAKVLDDAERVRQQEAQKPKEAPPPPPPTLEQRYADNPAVQDALGKAAPHTREVTAELAQRATRTDKLTYPGVTEAAQSALSYLQGGGKVLKGATAGEVATQAYKEKNASLKDQGLAGQFRLDYEAAYVGMLADGKVPTQFDMWNVASELLRNEPYASHLGKAKGGDPQAHAILDFIDGAGFMKARSVDTDAAGRWAAMKENVRSDATSYNALRDPEGRAYMASADPAFLVPEHKTDAPAAPKPTEAPKGKPFEPDAIADKEAHRAELADDIAKLKADNATFDTRLKQLAAERDRLSADITKAEAEHKTLPHGDKRRALGEKKMRLEGELRKKFDEIDALMADANKHTDDLHSLESRHAELGDEIHALKEDKERKRLTDEKKALDERAAKLIDPDVNLGDKRADYAALMDGYEKGGSRGQRVREYVNKERSKLPVSEHSAGLAKAVLGNDHPALAKALKDLPEGTALTVLRQSEKYPHSPEVATAMTKLVGDPVFKKASPEVQKQMAETHAKTAELSRSENPQVRAAATEALANMQKHSAHIDFGGDVALQAHRWEHPLKSSALKDIAASEYDAANHAALARGEVPSRYDVIQHVFSEVKRRAGGKVDLDVVEAVDFMNKNGFFEVRVNTDDRLGLEVFLEKETIYRYVKDPQAPAERL